MPASHELTSPTEPTATRPYIRDDYGIPKSKEGVLPWSFALERLARHAITGCPALPDGRPHARPVWGVVVMASYFGGGPTRLGAQLTARPDAVVHLRAATRW